MNTFIEATAEQGKIFYREFYNKGKVVMLNLLKFKTVADYADHEHLKPKSEITGKEAYQLYMKNTLPLLTKAGSRVLFHGSCKGFLIGPETEYWDEVLLVEHQSVQQFITFAQNKEYLKGADHRTAALENSRLLPISYK
jgi:uncharacterized protein (DUF1330 family)